MTTEKGKGKTEQKYNSDLTPEEKKMLDQENLHKDGGVDDQLRNRSKKVDFAGSDLDVPGRQSAKRGGGNLINDEENKVHSQGGSSKNNLEEQDGKL
ncbi:hypothetical protein [Flavimarina sp. Hel_I_48]|uniref:hypothetical protein n=1 Tax=Flavimarina sp. Hel_I_48 TaxID=1392488 RepID=UPI0004DF4971|nr:hypothetical protein [Flavimarina sp. Hel_I_48]